MKKYGIGLFILLLTFFAVGCARKPQQKTLKIAVIPKGTTHEFWKSVHRGAQQAADELNIQIIWQGPLREDDRESQITVLENMINTNVDGIVLAPLDDMGLRLPVAQAKQAGIPVVIFDSGLKSEDYVSFVATDNFAGGQMAGRFMVELLGGKGKVVLLRYAEGSESTTQREAGFLSVVSQTPDIQIVSDNQYGGATMETAMRAAEHLLSRFRTPDGQIAIDGMFCPNESTTLGALQAIQGLGFAGKLKLVGFDSSEKMIDALQKGYIHGFIVQNPKKMGYLAVKTLVEYIQGKPIQKRIDTGATLVTLQNYQHPDILPLIRPLEHP